MENPGRWEQVRLLPPGAVVTRPPGRPAVCRAEVDGIVFDEVPENGFGMLVAWLAGPGHLLRQAGDPARPAGDQAVVDESIAEYLADARIAPPPSGYRWFQRVPDGHDSLGRAHARINAHLRDADPGDEAVRPGQFAPLVAAAVAGLYR